MRSNPPAKPTVLVLRALKLGDLLVAVPALKGIRAAFAHHQVVLAAPQWLGPVVDLIPAVDQLVPLAGLQCALPEAFDGVDVAVNLHGNGAQSRALLEGLHPVRRVGHASPGRDGTGWDGPKWDPGLHERRRWVELLRFHGIAAHADDVGIELPSQRPALTGATVIHVGASHGSRHWPVERFAAVARTLAGEGHTVVLTGDAHDAPRAAAAARLAQLPEVRNLAGRLGLGDFAALIAAAAVVVSADTGAAHLASAYGTPSVVLFGPAPPSQWGPPPGPHLVLTDGRLRRGEVFSAVPDPALLAVQVRQVLAAVATVTSPAGCL